MSQMKQRENKRSSAKYKAGIYKKMNEFMTMCVVEMSFLVFSEAGKPYSFASPSMEKIASRLMKDDNENNVGPEPIVKAYKKLKVEDLMKQDMDLNEKVEVEAEKMKILKGSRNEKQFSKMWWNCSLDDSLSVEEMQQRHQAFCELHDSLCDVTSRMLGKGGGDGSLFSGRVGNGGSVSGGQA